MPTPAGTAPAPSPFGVFADGSSSFGGFGSGNAAPAFASRPLFGAAEPSKKTESVEETEDETKDDETNDGDDALDGANDATQE